MYYIGKHIEDGDLVPVSTLASDAAGIASLFENERDIIDVANEDVYIADIGGDDGTVVYGVMVAHIDTYDMFDDDDPVEWALGNVPAPGTGAEGRMALISVDEAAYEIGSRIDDFYVVRS